MVKWGIRNLELGTGTAIGCDLSHHRAQNRFYSTIHKMPELIGHPSVLIIPSIGTCRREGEGMGLNNELASLIC